MRSAILAILAVFLFIGPTTASSLNAVENPSFSNGLSSWQKSGITNGGGISIVTNALGDQSMQSIDFPTSSYVYQVIDRDGDDGLLVSFRAKYLNNPGHLDQQSLSLRNHYWSNTELDLWIGLSGIGIRLCVRDGPCEDGTFVPPVDHWVQYTLLADFTTGTAVLSVGGVETIATTIGANGVTTPDTHLIVGSTAGVTFGGYAPNIVWDDIFVRYLNAPI